MLPKAPDVARCPICRLQIRHVPLILDAGHDPVEATELAGHKHARKFVDLGQQGNLADVLNRDVVLTCVSRERSSQDGVGITGCFSSGMPDERTHVFDGQERGPGQDDGLVSERVGSNGLQVDQWVLAS